MDDTRRPEDDEKSWHLLILNKPREVTACVCVSGAPEHRCSKQVEGPRLSGGHAQRVEGYLLERNRRRAWARAAGRPRLRRGWWVGGRQRESLHVRRADARPGGLQPRRILAAPWGMTTATVRHSSSTILRRLGGSPSRRTVARSTPTSIPRSISAGWNYCVSTPGARCEPRRAGLVELLREKLTSGLVLGDNRGDQLPPSLAAARVRTQVAAA